MKGGTNMPKDELKNRIRFSTTLDKDVERKLKEYSKQSMIPISKLVDTAIARFIESLKKYFIIVHIIVCPLFISNYA